MPEQVYEMAGGWRVTYSADTREGTATLDEDKVVAPFTVSEHGLVTFRPDDEVPMYVGLDVQRWIGYRGDGKGGLLEDHDDVGRAGQT